MEDRSEFIKIYVSEQLKQEIQEEAEKEDLPISSFGRQELKKRVQP